MHDTKHSSRRAVLRGELAGVPLRPLATTTCLVLGFAWSGLQGCASPTPAPEPEPPYDAAAAARQDGPSPPARDTSGASRDDAAPPADKRDAAPLVDAAPIKEADTAAAPSDAPDGRDLAAVDARVSQDALGVLPEVVYGDSKCRDFLVCDGFEGDALDGNVWNLPSDHPDLGIAKDRFARGHGALKAGFTGGAWPVMSLKKIPNELKEHFFGRMFLWSQDPRPTFGDQGFFAHVELFRATRFQEYIGYAVGVVGALRVTSPSDDAIDIHGFDTMKWVCVEWEFDAKAHKVTTWWNDGKGEVRSDNSKKDPGRWAFGNGQTMFDTFQLGVIPVTNGSTPLRVWIDEFALHNERIGCNR